jgi:hypothetical protein
LVDTCESSQSRFYIEPQNIHRSPLVETAALLKRAALFPVAKNCHLNQSRDIHGIPASFAVVID